MAVLNRDEFLDKIKGYIGESSDDKALSFLEDMTDTFDTMYNASHEEISWKQKYEENDASWRDKYRKRFYDDDAADNSKKELDEGEPKTLTFAGLFKQGGN